ncbi:hypothetical protein [Nitrobacter sp.]|uniref:hypothetical protein n=1 Tax=Nitrobacter sp. TaxID=29420 RepID=UPI00399D6F05
MVWNDARNIYVTGLAATGADGAAVPRPAAARLRTFQPYGKDRPAFAGLFRLIPAPGLLP